MTNAVRWVAGTLLKMLASRDAAGVGTGHEPGVQEARPAPASPSAAAAVADPVVSDERERITDLRTVAKWQLAALGAVATLAFTGVALNKLPNAGMASEGGLLALVLAALGALLVLISVTVMISLVGWVLAPQYRSLDEQLKEDERRARSSTGHAARDLSNRWYNQAVWYLPDVHVKALKTFKETQDQDYQRYDRLSRQVPLKSVEAQEFERLQTRFAEYYGPVSLRLHWRNKREIVAVRARTALSRLSFLGALAAFGVVLYLGASAYRTTEALHTFGLPAYGVWRPPAAVTPATLSADLGAECPLVRDRAKGVQVLVLDETPAEKTYQILVTHPGCRPFQYVVARADVVARDPFVLPVDGQRRTAP